MGYNDIKLTPFIADSGYDISANKNGQKILFECKKYTYNIVSSRNIRIFADACRRMGADKGIFITTTDFTSTVFEEQNQRSIEIDFWNGKELVRRMKNLEMIDWFRGIRGFFFPFYNW